MTTKRKTPKKPESFAAGVGRGMRRAAKTARKVARIRTARRYIFGRTAKSSPRSLDGSLLFAAFPCTAKHVGYVLRQSLKAAGCVLTDFG